MPQNKQRTHERDIQVGRRIRLTRLKKGMTQAKLGDLVGVTFQQIQKYERGLNGLSIERLNRISQALDLAPKDLGLVEFTGEPLPALNKQKVQLIEAWDQIRPKYQAKILPLIKAIAGVK
jgi:transcriptional regulator with XRE-family HTH domain